jgi:hypothetical protein
LHYVYTGKLMENKKIGQEINGKFHKAYLYEYKIHLKYSLLRIFGCYTVLPDKWRSEN